MWVVINNCINDNCAGDGLGIMLNYIISRQRTTSSASLVLRHGREYISYAADGDGDVIDVCFEFPAQICFFVTQHFVKAQLLYNNSINFVE